MSDWQSNAPKILIAIGIFFIFAGALLYFTKGKWGWLGHLPGDIRIEKENFRLYFPITTMILLSVLFTLVVNLVRKIF